MDNRKLANQEDSQEKQELNDLLSRCPTWKKLIKPEKEEGFSSAQLSSLIELINAKDKNEFSTILGKKIETPETREKTPRPSFLKQISTLTFFVSDSFEDLCKDLMRLQKEFNQQIHFSNNRPKNSK